jgi:hypothetical protein
MIIKKAVDQTCSKCGCYEKQISPEQHGCDQCKKPIVPFGNDERLDVGVFYLHKATKHFYFCSWRCVFNFVMRLKTDHFFTLPYVVFDHKIKGRRAVDFFREVRRRGTGEKSQ